MPDTPDSRGRSYGGMNGSDSYTMGQLNNFTDTKDFKQKVEENKSTLISMYSELQKFRERQADQLVQYESQLYQKADSQRYQREIEHRRNIANIMSRGWEDQSKAFEDYADRERKHYEDLRNQRISDERDIEREKEKSRQNDDRSNEEQRNKFTQMGEKFASNLVRKLSDGFNQFIENATGRLDFMGSFSQGASMAYQLRQDFGALTFSKNTLTDFKNAFTSAYYDMRGEGIFVDPQTMYQSYAKLNELVNLTGTNRDRLAGLLTAVTKIEQSASTYDVTTDMARVLEGRYGDEFITQLAYYNEAIQGHFENFTDTAINAIQNNSNYQFNLSQIATQLFDNVKDQQDWILKTNEDNMQSIGALADQINAPATEHLVNKYMGLLSTDSTSLTSLFQSDPILAGLMSQEGINVTGLNAEELTERMDEFIPMMAQAMQTAVKTNDVNTLNVYKTMGLLDENLVNTLAGTENINLDEIANVVNTGISQNEIDAVGESITKKKTIVDMANDLSTMAGFELASMDYQSGVLSGISFIAQLLQDFTGGIGGSGGALSNILSSFGSSFIGSAVGSSGSSGVLSSVLGVAGPIALAIGGVLAVAYAINEGVKDYRDAYMKVNADAFDDIEELSGKVDSTKAELEEQGQSWEDVKGVKATYAQDPVTGKLVQTGLGFTTDESEVTSTSDMSNAYMASSLDQKMTEAGYDITKPGDVFAAGFTGAVNIIDVIGSANAANAYANAIPKITEKPEGTGYELQDIYSGLGLIGTGEDLEEQTTYFYNHFDEFYDAYFNKDGSRKVDGSRILISPKDTKNTYTLTGEAGNWGGVSIKQGLSEGISAVPYDEYPALLHKGEMVIPARRANYLRRMLGMQTVNASDYPANIHTGNNNFVQSIPEFAAGDDAVAFAQANLGAPYDQGNREGKNPNVFDCSSLTARAYGSEGAGISGLGIPTAAGIGESWPNKGFSVIYGNNGELISKEDALAFGLKPGDVLLYNWNRSSNGRYWNINHAALFYSGDQQIHTSSPKKPLRIEGLWDNIAMILRYGSGGTGQASFGSNANQTGTTINQQRAKAYSALLGFTHIPWVAAFLGVNEQTGTGGSVSGGLSSSSAGISGGVGGTANPLRICTDGAPASEGRDGPYGSKYWQAGTAKSVDGRALNAFEINYMVHPGAIPSDLNKALSVVIDHGTGKAVWGILGEVGPTDNGWGEVSIAAARALGYSDASGKAGPGGNFEVRAFPGVKPDWSYSTINQQAAEAGRNMTSQNLLSDSTTVASYDQGTPWVPDDQLAMIHKGEMVVPANQNPLNENGVNFENISTSVVDALDEFSARVCNRLDKIITHLQQSDKTSLPNIQRSARLQALSEYRVSY